LLHDRLSVAITVPIGGASRRDMDKPKTIALVPVLNGEPQAPIFVGTEDQCEQYWYDNPLEFLNKRVDTYEMCPTCGEAYPELEGEAFGYKVCQGCADSIAADLATLRRELEADAERRECKCCTMADVELTDGFCDGCYDHMPEELTGKVSVDPSKIDDLPF